MAKSNWGITSGFIGKLGNVVGFNWKGINLQRALIKSADPRTKKQQLQRAKFALSGKLGSVLYEALYEGYRHEARELRSTQSGLFLKYNLENFGGTAEAITINYEALQLSKGILRGVSFGEPSLDGTTVSVDITNTANTGRRVSMADRVYVCALCPEQEESICTAVGTRADSTVSLTIPATWGEKRFYLYGFVIGASSNNEAMASKTAYIGAFGTAADNTASTPATDGNSNGNSGGSQSGGTSGGSSQGGDSGNSQNSDKPKAPVISGQTTFADTTQVTITNGTEGATVYYTTDGTTPTSASTEYTEPFTLSASANVKAIAIKDGVSSEVAIQAFVKDGAGYGDTN